MNSSRVKTNRLLATGIIVFVLFCTVPLFILFLQFLGVDAVLSFMFTFFFSLFAFRIGKSVARRLPAAYGRRRLGTPNMTISKETLRVGEAFTVTFEHIFQSDITVDEITVRLIYKETVIYETKDNISILTYEEAPKTFRLPGDSYRTGHIISHSLDMKIPDGGMHTLKVPDNQIQWFVRMETKIPKLADFVEERELLVIPELCLSQKVL